MRSYDPSRIVYMPGRRLYGFWMFLKNVPSVLAKVSNTFAKRNINIIKVLATSVENGADALFYCDFTDSDAEPGDLVKEFKKIEEVRDIKIIKPVIPGLVIDNIHYIIMISRGRYIINREECFRGFIKGIREEFGSAGEALQYRIGIDAGKGLWRGIENYAKDINNKIEILKLIFMNSGYGKMDIKVNLNEKKADIKIYDSIECSQGIGSKEPYSHYIRGMVAGVFEEVFKDDVEVREVKCIAIGDEYCEFKVNIKGKDI